MEYELSVRAHIRNLLLDYALAHLTTNYETSTEDSVAEVCDKFSSTRDNSDAGLSFGL